uniref:Uncharacterized protein n=1 Tax=Anguilla anguilla TaxID=7936 RepID=A0A0E9W8B9_ANGAN
MIAIMSSKTTRYLVTLLITCMYLVVIENPIFRRW